MKKTYITRNLALLLFTVTISGFLSYAQTSCAASLDHFTWDIVASPQSAGTPFNAALTASDSGGNVVSNFSGNVTISTETVAAPQMVISEVDSGSTNQVEFTNPSTNSVDVSRWRVAFYDSTT